jgi:hypothetical protein
MVVMAALPLIDRHKKLGPLLSNMLGVLPKRVLLPFGNPALDEDEFRILSDWLG